MILNDFYDQTAFTYLSSEAWNRESEDQIIYGNNFIIITEMYNQGDIIIIIRYPLSDKPEKHYTTHSYCFQFFIK